MRLHALIGRVTPRRPLPPDRRLIGVISRRARFERAQVTGKLPGPRGPAGRAACVHASALRVDDSSSRDRHAVCFSLLHARLRDITRSSPACGTCPGDVQSSEGKHCG